MVAVADNTNFTLLYQVRPGVMDKSFGIEVAKLANFPDRVIEVTLVRQVLLKQKQKQKFIIHSVITFYRLRKKCLQKLKIRNPTMTNPPN